MELPTPGVVQPALGLWSAVEVDRTTEEVTNISAQKAIEILQDKIRGRMQGGPAQLRRAFQLFDADGSGSIDHNEFKAAMRMRTNLEFSDALISEIMGSVGAGGTGGELNFNTFCELVMGDKGTQTGYGASRSQAASGATYDHFMMNEMQFLANVRRTIRKRWKDCRTAFVHAGNQMNYEQVREMLFMMNLDLVRTIYHLSLIMLCTCGV